MSSKPLLDTVVSHFRERKMRFDLMEEKSVISTGFRCKHANLRCVVDVKEDREMIVIYSFLSANAPEEMRPAVAEFLALANWGLIIGNFELDWRDGEIRYKTSVYSKGLAITSECVRHLIGYNIATMDRYMPALMSVIFGNVEPQKAILRAEMRHKRVPKRLAQCCSPEPAKCSLHREGSCIGGKRDAVVPKGDGPASPCPYRREQGSTESPMGPS